MLLNPYQRKKEHIPFDVERWYPHVKDHTFFTQTLPFSPREAAACVRYYRQRWLGRKEYRGEQFGPADCKIILSVRKRLEDCLAKEPFSSSGAFVRLSSRSPKDGIPLQGGDRSSLRDLYEGHLKSLADSKWDVDAPNTKAAAVFRAQTGVLCVRTADEALNLILSSERVALDLQLALNCHLGEPGSKTKAQDNDEKTRGQETDAEHLDKVWKTSILIREWDLRVSDDMEFRAFVSGGKLRAISQYNHYCFYKHLEALRPHIVSAVNKRWLSVAGQLAAAGYKDLVIDFGLFSATDDSSQEPRYDARIIELNPFAKTTGACLFSWSKDHDILTKGTVGAAPPLRLHSAPVEGIQGFVEGVLLPRVIGAVDTSQKSWPSVEQDEGVPYYVLLEKVLGRRVISAERSSRGCVVS